MSINQSRDIYVAWKTVTYRSVLMVLLGAALIFGVVMHLAFPQFTDSTVKAAGNLSTGLLEKVAGLAPPLKGRRPRFRSRRISPRSMARSG